MSISHAPPGSPVPDISETSPEGAAEPTTPAPVLDLEPIVPASSRRARVPRWLRRTTGPVLLLALWQLLSGTGVLTADVLASPGRIAQVDALATEVSAAGVPMLAVDDSMQIATHAATLGLLDAAGLDDVQSG